jgi:hypothetical protein
VILASSKILHQRCPEPVCFIIHGQNRPLSIKQASPSGTSISTVIFMAFTFLKITGGQASVLEI